MTSSGFINWQVPLWQDTLKTKKVLGGIPLNARVVVLDSTENRSMFCVQYKQYTGWVDAQYLEPFTHALPTNCVDLTGIQTPDEYDAQQYILWDGHKQVNMCGELCIAFNTNKSLTTVLYNWKQKKPPLYKRIFGVGRAAGTTSSDLVQIYETMTGSPVAERLELKLKKYTPYALFKLVEDHEVIVAVNIDGNTGQLRGSGVPHWVSVVKVVMDRINFGWVDVYNPFNNCVERYSWREFLATTRNYPYGCIRRKEVA